MCSHGKQAASGGTGELTDPARPFQTQEFYPVCCGRRVSTYLHHLALDSAFPERPIHVPSNPPKVNSVFSPISDVESGTWSSIGNAIAYVCVGEFMRHHDARRCIIIFVDMGATQPAECARCSIPVFSPRIGTWNISIYYNLFPLGFRAVRHR